LAAEESTKNCAKCGTTKPLSEFRFFPSRNGYRARCKLCLSEDHKEWNAKARPLTLEHAARWKRKNKERHRAYTAAWKILNREQALAQNQVRRARKAKSQGSFTAADIRAMLSLQNGRCAACHMPVGDSFHRDHIIPLASGGSNDISNIQLLCPPCNLSKGARSMDEFLKTRNLMKEGEHAKRSNHSCGLVKHQR
jgi:5-methylcytosine-specific restriction endonuclease McrA